TDQRVLMVGWMDDEALHRTLTTGRATYWSRSRGEYWRKGDTSGHVQWVRSVALDCDGDTLLVQVDQVGQACHRPADTCFDGADSDATDRYHRERDRRPAAPLPPRARPIRSRWAALKAICSARSSPTGRPSEPWPPVNGWCRSRCVSWPTRTPRCRCTAG